MKFPERPASVPIRAGVAITCLWVTGAVAFVIFNRYRGGTDWDSLTDLFLLVIALPTAFLSLGIAIWAAGKVASVITASVVALSIAIPVGVSLCDDHLRHEARDKSDRERHAEIEAKYGKECAERARQGGAYNEYDYILCLEDLANGRGE